MGLPLLKTDTEATPTTFRVVPDLGTPAPAAPAPAKKPAGKLNLGGISKAAANKETATYPVAELTDEQREMVSELLTQNAQAKALEGSIELLKAEVNGLAMPQWFRHAQGQITPPSSIVLPGLGTDQAMLVVAGETGGRYKAVDADAVREKLAALLGEDDTDQSFDQTATLKIDIDKVQEDLRQTIVDEVVEVFTRHNALHAISAKQALVMKPIVRKARFQSFPLATNLAINALLPLIPSFKRRA